MQQLYPLGVSIPSDQPHALSVSLPTWKQNVGWASGDLTVINQMATGYPRFFIHRTIQKLASIMLEKCGSCDELCMLFPTASAANECNKHLLRHANRPGKPHADFRTIHLAVEDCAHPLQIYAVIFPIDTWKVAKSFWQHAGMGVSSRYAEACLSRVSKIVVSQQQPGVDYELSDENQDGTIAKLEIRKRIAMLASYGDTSPPHNTNGTETKIYPTEDDVFLYPTGMSAIWHAHRMILLSRPHLKPVCFGFPYTDTYQVLQRWGPGCHFFGNHPDQNLADLEALLQTLTSGPSARSPPISAVFCEWPSNPLLHCMNIISLRKLADQHGFPIIIDDTIGSFVNTDLLPYVDVIATSLSKLFSGKADVMGGSLLLNARFSRYEEFRTHLKETYLDSYYPPDAIRMELNSRDFASRVRAINPSARALCTFLRSRSLCFSSENTSAPPNPEQNLFVIKQVFYPEYITPSNYDMCRRPNSPDNFGPLFSLTFISQLASEMFYNALPCAKGPSLGTNFTLVCPYTILAHYNEMEWAAGYGVEEGLVRVSVGMENIETLIEWFRYALGVAEAAVRET